VTLIHDVGRFTELHGVDVIVAHRLLKNSVDADGYVLLSDDAYGYVDAAIHRPDDDELRRILPVNPNLNEVLGEPAHAELNAITEPIDSVVIFRRAEFVPDIVSAAIDQGVKVIWMQDGIRSPASRRARPARGPSGGYGRLYALTAGTACWRGVMASGRLRRGR
jgi:hypothetical protein